MQTFLPFESFEESARVLDRQRLGKQRVECLQILKGGGWANHPAAVMWRDSELLLIRYGLAVCMEWIDRGYADTCSEKIAAFAACSEGATRPTWLGDPAFHAAHRSNLLRKDPVWYGQFGWSEPADMPYIWPGKIPKDPVYIPTPLV